MTGEKHDDGKDRWDLLPFGPLQDAVKVLTFGARKYSPNNWQNVEEWEQRYFAAAMRHLVAYRQGEKSDSETCLPHLAHAMCCLLFLAELDANTEPYAE